MGKYEDQINNRTVIVFGTLVHETEKAVLIKTDDEPSEQKDVWLPKSQFKKPMEKKEGKYRDFYAFFFPYWIAETKGLMYLEEEPEDIEFDEREVGDR